MRRPPQAGNCTAPEAVDSRTDVFEEPWGVNGDSAGFGSLRARERHEVGEGPQVGSSSLSVKAGDPFDGG